ncbi:MAG: hypothetical protein QGH15_05085 [Kiritimatiellia bacterium]|jgi:hypothetical protein|nr:hypothetical protein [Kiritimatiellia bacterium]
MNEFSEAQTPDWDLAVWKESLSIHVGTTYACHDCGNLVMVTKGGIGVMDMTCCGKQMEQFAGPRSPDSGDKE